MSNKKISLLSLFASVSFMNQSIYALADDNNNIQFEAAYTGEVWHNTTGGLQTGTEYIDNFDFTGTLPLNLFTGEQTTVFAYGLANTNSGLSSDLVGDLQGVSNIDTIGAVRLYELWAEQTFLSEKLRILVGLYDLNSEFDVIEPAGLFINSSHGIGPEFAQSGENGPSIFPTTSLSLRLKYQVNEDLSLKFVLLDAVAGDPNHPKRTTVILDGKGALLVAEVQYKMNDKYMLTGGSWFYNKEKNAFPHQRTTLQETALDFGFYGSLYGPLSQDHQIQAFVRFGIANNTTNLIKNYLGFGITKTSIFTLDRVDRLGFSAAIARASQRSIKTSFHETIFELTYQYPLSEQLTIQPDIQYIINPGLEVEFENALVFGIRLNATIAFGYN